MKIKSTLLIGTLFTTLLTFNGPAQAATDCNAVSLIGNAIAGTIQREMNNQVAGMSHRISRRKTLNIHGMNGVKFNGCTVYTSMKVTLKRKIRRNAHGNVSIKAKVSSFSANRVCLSDVKVTKVNLSRTLRIGEGFYKLAANKAIQNNQCFSR